MAKDDKAIATCVLEDFLERLARLAQADYELMSPAEKTALECDLWLDHYCSIADPDEKAKLVTPVLRKSLTTIMRSSEFGSTTKFRALRVMRDIAQQELATYASDGAILRSKGYETLNNENTIRALCSYGFNSRNESTVARNKAKELVRLIQAREL